MYTKICVDTIGEFSFDDDNGELPFGYGKTKYGFLIDAYNSDLKDLIDKCARELSNRSHEVEDNIHQDFFNGKIISYEEAYNKFSAFIKLSDEDLRFIKNLMFLLTDYNFNSGDVIQKLKEHYKDTLQNVEWHYIGSELNEYARRLSVISAMLPYNVPYEELFSKQVSDALYEMEKCNVTMKMGFNMRVTAITGISNRFFEYIFDTMMDAILFEVHNLINSGDTIKLCKNCGKLFVPLRSDALYCDNISPQDNQKTCKEYGNYQQWLRNIESNEATKLYRKIYMRKQMQTKRHPDDKEFLNEFEKYKSATKKWREDIKHSRKTNEQFLEWLKNINKQT